MFYAQNFVSHAHNLVQYKMRQDKIVSIEKQYGRETSSFGGTLKSQKEPCNTIANCQVSCVFALLVKSDSLQKLIKPR